MIVFCYCLCFIHIIYISESRIIVYLFSLDPYLKICLFNNYCIIVTCLVVTIYFRHRVSILNMESIPALNNLYISKSYNVLIFVTIFRTYFFETLIILLDSLIWVLFYVWKLREKQRYEPEACNLFLYKVAKAVLDFNKVVTFLV